MGIGGKRPFPNLGKQIRHIEITLEGDTQGQRIDKETDQPLKLTVRAVGDWRADDNVILSTKSGEYNTPGCQYSHKQSRVMPLSK
ncbi:hypothetical protein Xets_02158 [Xenorhabdus sp. TS4]|uniref:Uncharacterized protein n=1 Tax=Xenorhabdus ehlersii TaxID=290111 RepID=A0A2D0IKV8_9GAMM|nr:hypothetical protein [Xenorhabdus sp. TS4]PHM22407.1 hypothetical protein Xehl_03696 [Xenorhabdus ehlersii]